MFSLNNTLFKLYLTLLFIFAGILPLTYSQDIPNLSYSVAPNTIIITYSGSDNFPVNKLILSFNLDPSMTISSTWGTPWLDWQLQTKIDSYYEYINNVDLSGLELTPGESITFQFATTPYNPDAICTNITMTTTNGVGEGGETGESGETGGNTAVEIEAEASPAGDYSPISILTVPEPEEAESTNEYEDLTSINFNSSRLLVGYFESWAEDSTTQDPSGLTLANLPAYINVVNIAFVRPDCQYAGDLDISNTGLEFEQDGSVIQQAISILKSNNPITKVFLSVGGTSYNNWNNLDASAIAQLAVDLGVDGVDISYQPGSPNCAVSGGVVTCQTDSELQNSIVNMRNALADNMLLSITGQNVGAYGGSGAYQDSQPITQYTGLFVNFLQSQYVSMVDLINVLAYGAGEGYDPMEAYNAYQSYFSGPVTIGVEVPPDDSGSNSLTSDSLDELIDSLEDTECAGITIWSLQKAVTGTASDDNPDAEMIAQDVCDDFDLPDCEQSLGVLTD